VNDLDIRGIADVDGCSDGFVAGVSGDQQRAWRTCSLHTSADWMRMSAKRWLLKREYKFAM
jgi:hypothetical protein